MRKTEFWFVYNILLVGQLLLSTYCTFSPYLTLSILPVMVLCIPNRVHTSLAMLIALASGLFVDWLSDGMLGLNALALVPVAYARKGIIGLIFGNDLFARGEDFSARKNGYGPLSLAILLAQGIFLAIYVWADSAGTRPFLFNTARFTVSMAAGFLVSLPVSEVLAPDSRR